MNAPAIRRRRLAALLAGAMVPLVLLAGMLLPVTFEETEASWTDTTSARATTTAATIPAPTLTEECEFRPGVAGLAARVRVHWQLPPGYTLEQATLLRETDGIGSILEPVLGFGLSERTQENSDGTYTTTIPAGVLGGLLGLGSRLQFGIMVEDASGWTSEAAVIEARSTLLGIGFCNHLTE